MNFKKNVIALEDWDELVVRTYGKPYSFQQQYGCQSRGNFPISVPCEDEDFDFKNDTIPEVVNGSQEGVSFKAWLARDPKAPIGKEREDGHLEYVIELFWHRNFYPSIQEVANDLHAKGLLPAGDYTINIDW